MPEITPEMVDYVVNSIYNNPVLREKYKKVPITPFDIIELLGS